MIMDKFITLEGGEGSGKTTTAKQLKKKLELMGQKVILTREPGGSSFSEQIRTLIMENDLNIEEEALLFATARVNHIREVIMPALKDGCFVICDRYVDSSIVYQSHVGGCENVQDYNKYAYENCMPKKTFFFDISPQEALKRLDTNNREKNRFDKKGLQYHSQIYNGYKELARNIKRIITIDASKSTDDIVKEILLSLELKC